MININGQNQPSVTFWFDRCAAERPDAIALLSGGRQVTYAQLQHKSDRIAALLKARGVSNGTPIVCCMERSIELVVAILSILKAGGAYVPVDPSYPRNRIEHLVADAAARFVVAGRHIAPGIDFGSPSQVLTFEDLESDSTPDENYPEPQPAAPDDLAYVMYTSGSTGRPKGVMVEHRSIVRLVCNPNYCTITPDDVILQAAPVSFDAATFEIWGALLNGATLAILPPEATTLEQIGRAIREYGVTTLWLTAGLFHLMVEQRIEDLRPVRQLLAGGDVLSPKCVQTVLDKLPNCTLINGYGPTENTTFTCCHVMRPGDRVGDTVPIGRPISGTTVYILDENFQPVNPGQTGELYTGGAGVARGYWNNPDATAEKFVPDPFAGDGSKMYRTGDLARWNEDGCIEFLGRIDNQVKIRGHRIEPGEIEAVLETHPDLGQVCVAVDVSGDDGSKRLIAFYTLREGVAVRPATSELRDYLKLRLPQYMIPALFAAVERMPLSPNGKVDRAALLAVPLRQESGSSEDPAPASNAEQVIHETWKRLLRTSHVGLDDNFFDLGGDSLLLVAVHANLERLLAIEIPVTALFEHTTVRSLAKRLSEKDQDGPRFASAQSQAQKQREVFAKARMRRAGV